MKDTTKANIGYTLGGACTGYVLTRITGNVAEGVIIGGITGLSLSFVKQHKRVKTVKETIDANGNKITTVVGGESNPIKTLAYAFLAYYFAIPITCGLGLLIIGGIASR